MYSINKTSAEFRSIARLALKGKWPVAILAGFIVVLLGGSVSPATFSYTVNVDVSDTSSALDLGNSASLLPDWIPAVATVMLVAAIIYAILYFVVGSVIAIGYAKFNLDVVDHGDVKMGTIFSCMHMWKTAVVTRLLTSLIIFLWSLLLIIPGIIAAYSYAMTDYILAENPDMKATEAMKASKEMMKGNRFRLFCLELSFIGWVILCLFTCGLGAFALKPYEEAAYAAFYREVSFTE